MIIIQEDLRFKCLVIHIIIFITTGTWISRIPTRVSVHI